MMGSKTERLSPWKKTVINGKENEKKKRKKEREGKNNGIYV